VQGSVLWNRATSELSLTAGPALQRAGIAGRVYLDENVNGRFDAGEPVIPEAFVRLGQSGALTDSAGVFRVWDVVPFEPVALQVDSLSLPSPLWVPATAAASISLAPNRFLPFDVAIVAGGTVEGRVVQVPGGLLGVPRFQDAYHGELDKDAWGLVHVAQQVNYKGTIWDTWDPAAPPFLEYIG